MTDLTFQNAQKTFTTYVTLFASLNEVALQELLADQKEQLASQWQVLKDLALAGEESSLGAVLETMLDAWAMKEGVETLLRAKKAKKKAVDPSDPAITQWFLAACTRQYHIFSAEVLLLLKQGKDQRMQMQEERARDWQTIALQGMEDQRQQSQRWWEREQDLFSGYQQTNQQWVHNQQQLNQHWWQRDQALFNQYQQANQEWAHVALTGVQQAQLGMQQWYDFAARTQANVTGLLAGTEQQQVQLVQEAVQKAEARKVRSRLLKFLLLGLAVCLFLGLCGVLSQSMLLAALH